MKGTMISVFGFFIFVSEILWVAEGKFSLRNLLSNSSSNSYSLQSNSKQLLDSLRSSIDSRDVSLFNKEFERFIQALNDIKWTSFGVNKLIPGEDVAEIIKSTDGMKKSILAVKNNLQNILKNSNELDLPVIKGEVQSLDKIVSALDALAVQFDASGAVTRNITAAFESLAKQLNANSANITAAIALPVDFTFPSAASLPNSFDLMNLTSISLPVLNTMFPNNTLANLGIFDKNAVAGNFSIPTMFLNITNPTVILQNLATPFAPIFLPLNSSFANFTLPEIDINSAKNLQNFTLLTPLSMPEIFNVDPLQMIMDKLLNLQNALASAAEFPFWNNLGFENVPNISIPDYFTNMFTNFIRMLNLFNPIPGMNIQNFSVSKNLNLDFTGNLYDVSLFNLFPANLFGSLLTVPGSNNNGDSAQELLPFRSAKSLDVMSDFKDALRNLEFDINKNKSLHFIIDDLESIFSLLTNNNSFSFNLFGTNATAGNQFAAMMNPFTSKSGSSHGGAADNSSFNFLSDLFSFSPALMTAGIGDGLSNPFNSMYAIQATFVNFYNLIFSLFESCTSNFLTQLMSLKQELSKQVMTHDSSTSVIVPREMQDNLDQLLLKGNFIADLFSISNIKSMKTQLFREFVSNKSDKSDMFDFYLIPNMKAQFFKELMNFKSRNSKSENIESERLVDESGDNKFDKSDLFYLFFKEIMNKFLNLKTDKVNLYNEVLDLKVDKVRFAEDNFLKKFVLFENFKQNAINGLESLANLKNGFKDFANVAGGLRNKNLDLRAIQDNNSLDFSNLKSFAGNLGLDDLMSFALVNSASSTVNSRRLYAMPEFLSADVSGAINQLVALTGKDTFGANDFLNATTLLETLGFGKLETVVGSLQSLLSLPMTVAGIKSNENGFFAKKNPQDLLSFLNFFRRFNDLGTSEHFLKKFNLLNLFNNNNASLSLSKNDTFVLQTDAFNFDFSQENEFKVKLFSLMFLPDIISQFQKAFVELLLPNKRISGDTVENAINSTTRLVSSLETLNSLMSLRQGAGVQIKPFQNLINMLRPLVMKGDNFTLSNRDRDEIEIGVSNCIRQISSGALLNLPMSQLATAINSYLESIEDLNALLARALSSGNQIPVQALENVAKLLMAKGVMFSNATKIFMTTFVFMFVEAPASIRLFLWDLLIKSTEMPETIGISKEIFSNTHTQSGQNTFDIFPDFENASVKTKNLLTHLASSFVPSSLSSSSLSNENAVRSSDGKNRTPNNAMSILTDLLKFPAKQDISINNLLVDFEAEGTLVGAAAEETMKMLDETYRSVKKVGDYISAQQELQQDSTAVTNNIQRSGLSPTNLPLQSVRSFGNTNLLGGPISFPKIPSMLNFQQNLPLPKFQLQSLSLPSQSSFPNLLDSVNELQRNTFGNSLSNLGSNFGMANVDRLGIRNILRGGR